ncbi:unnamed protein product [Closterium sp. Yama58-4]|nr:unnamed protein product [Closterium sp. Yama58-4]
MHRGISSAPGIVSSAAMAALANHGKHHAHTMPLHASPRNPSHGNQCVPIHLLPPMIPRAAPCAGTGRGDGDYNGWGLHLWGDVEAETDWQHPLPSSPAAATGGVVAAGGGGMKWVEWRVQLKPHARTVNVLPHRGDWKDCTWTIDMATLPAPPPSTSTQRGPTVWLISDCQRAFLHAPNLDRLPKGSLDLFKAHWVSADEIAVDWDYSEGDYGEEILFALHASESASLSLTEDGVHGADSVIPLTLDPAGLSPAVSPTLRSTIFCDGAWHGAMKHGMVQ